MPDRYKWLILRHPDEKVEDAITCKSWKEVVEKCCELVNKGHTDLRVLGGLDDEVYRRGDGTRKNWRSNRGDGAAGSTSP